MARRLATCEAFNECTSLPSNKTAPVSGLINLDTSLSHVDFPEPFGPIKLTISPWLICKSLTFNEKRSDCLYDTS